MYLYYNTLFEKKQPFFVRKFKFLYKCANIFIFDLKKVFSNKKSLVNFRLMCYTF